MFGNKEVNDNVIEKMMGHKRGLDGTYLVVTPEMAFNEFKNGILSLTIDQTEKQKVTIESLQEEKSELEFTRGEWEDMKKEIRLLKRYSKRDQITKKI